MLYKLLRVPKVLRKKDFFLVRDTKMATLTLGNKNATWTFHPNILTHDSIVYSVGVGNDISFDLSLIEKYGVTIHAFDPTPKSIQWIQNQQLPVQFRFHESGLAATDGTANFALPENPDHVSASILNNSGNTNFFVGEVKRLQTIMHELNHSRIDLLKMDIEGAEYEVIDDIVTSKVKIKQLLIEFHHRFAGVGIEKSKDAIRKLQENGFAVFHVSESGEEISFINPSL
jgi:FkbM family methyltransferase